MLDFKILLIIILLGIAIYLIYNLYTTQAKLLERVRENINQKIEDECDDLNERLDKFEEQIDRKINECNKKVKDLYSMQNKVNEVQKMNNQSIINQFHQFDEGMEGIEEIDETKNQIFNSLENSQSNKNLNKQNCFIKVNNVKNQDKEMFYMSTDNKNKEKMSKTVSDVTSSPNTEESTTSSSCTKSSSSSNSNPSSKSSSNKSSEKSNSTTVKKGKKKDSEKSTVLELSGDFIKTNCVNTNSPLANSAFKILNESSNIIKNSSFGKLSSMGGENDSSSNNSNSNSDSDYFVNNNDVIKIVNNSYDSQDSQNKKSSSDSNDDLEDEVQMLGPGLVGIINLGKKKQKIIDI